MHKKTDIHSECLFFVNIETPNCYLFLNFFPLILQIIFNRFPGSAELYFFKESCQPGNLLQPQYFIFVHAQMPGYPGIRTSQLMQLADDVAHQVDIVRASGPVMPDRTRHPAVDGLIDDRYRQLAAFPFVNILIVQHNAVTVKTVDDYIQIFFAVIITDDGHSVTVFLDAVIQQLQLRRRHRVGVVGIRLDFFDWYGIML